MNAFLPFRNLLSRRTSLTVAGFTLASWTAAACLAGCKSKAAPEPRAKTSIADEGSASAKAESPTKTESARATVSAATAKSKPTPSVPASPGDPEEGDFTLEEATAGLTGSGTLMADIETEMGTLSCELYEDKAPITVANFVGLARGTRPWKKGNTWVKEPLYDDNVFHRIVKGFVIQGGDPEKTGAGGPGYMIPDEVWENARHDQRGQMAMANRGPNTNGSQFFILDIDRPARHLDGGYTIFGKCSPDETIIKLASVRPGPETPAPKIKTVKIHRATP